jgi:hypothetical protein
VHHLPPFLITLMLVVVTSLTLGGDLLATFDSLTRSAASVRSRSEENASTMISGPLGLSISATSTFQITLKNEGSVSLGQFADWDAIIEVQKAPGLGIAYLTYTEDANPDTDQWTVKEIYLNAASSTAEIVGPGILDPAEEVVILANPSPSIVANTYDRATFVTPNGITTKVLFEVVP